MSRLARAVLGAVGAVVVGIALTGCGGSRTAQMNNLVRTITLSSSQLIAHSADHHYSVHQVELAFARQGLPLRNVTPKNYRGLLAFLDGRPAHPVFVYVNVGGCKCALRPATHNANVTHHGNVEVLWRSDAKSAVRAALRDLD